MFTFCARLAVPPIDKTRHHYIVLVRNMLSTGVTQGERPVVLVGQRRVLAIAVRNQGGRRQWSKLKEWLQLQYAGLTRPA